MPMVNGVWQEEDAGVANRIASITASSAPYMRQARANGLSTANRRGLGNSSIAAGASAASAIERAAPVAAQEASQIHARNLAEHDGGIRTSQMGMQIAAAEREALARSISDMTGQRYNALAATLANSEIPASARSSIVASINDQATQAMRYLQNLYGVQLSAGAPVPANVPVAPTPGINGGGSRALNGLGTVLR